MIINSMTEQYSKVSVSLNKSISSKVKKEHGIYFTPAQLIERVINHLKVYIQSNKLKIDNILEPSFGSGEFISALDKRFSDVSITGVEYYKPLFDKVEKTGYNNDVTLKCMDFLDFNPGDKYSLIIGNPPYYILPKNSVDKKYFRFLDGRPNIYTLFIIKSLEMLKPNGLSAFILPP